MHWCYKYFSIAVDWKYAWNLLRCITASIFICSLSDSIAKSADLQKPVPGCSACNISYQLMNFGKKKKKKRLWNFKGCETAGTGKTLISLLCPKQSTNKNRKQIVCLLFNGKHQFRKLIARFLSLQDQGWLLDFFSRLAEEKKKIPLGKPNGLVLQAV